MSRLQLALNVNDIDEAVAFYSTLFDAEPAKRRPGYANFVVADPPLKLVLFENPEVTGTLNHLGVERESVTEVEQQARRLGSAGLIVDTDNDVDCCYARQDKHWVTGPDGQRWENYVVIADTHPALEGRTTAAVPGAQTAGGCCGSRQVTPAARVADPAPGGTRARRIPVEPVPTGQRPG